MADTAEMAHEAIRVGLRTIEQTAGNALKVYDDLELAHHDRVLFLSFDFVSKLTCKLWPLATGSCLVGSWIRRLNRLRSMLIASGS